MEVKKVEAQVPMMRDRKTEGKAGQLGFEMDLVILNKSKSEPLVLRMVGCDGKV